MSDVGKTGILHNMHADHNSGNFIASSAGDNSWQSQVSGLANGTSIEKEKFKNHYGREFYKKIDSFGVTVANKDELDAGFRPTSLTGIYTL